MSLSRQFCSTPDLINVAREREVDRERVNIKEREVEEEKGRERGRE